MLSEVFHFLKYPVYTEDDNPDIKYRLTVFYWLLGYALMFSLVLGMLNTVLASTFGLDFGKHAVNDFIEQYSPWVLLFIAVVLAPVLEELCFRGPLIFFRRSPFFGWIFYVFTLVFGFYHLTNFDVTPTTLLFSPLLVAPQLSVGVFLGFIRVRFGLLWGMALHAMYNLILIGPLITLKLLNILPE
tara:strand:+ start:177 stop:734 length:558 start_codon:yes stop_codon:yes gene_type:complete